MAGKRQHMLVLVAGLVMGVATVPLSLSAGEVVSKIARGGQLYDKWFEVLDVEAPAVAHPAYPPSGGYADKAKDTWRCKECHGWDYRGKEGAYATGKHATGIVGLARFQGGDAAKVRTILSDANHRYGENLNEVDQGDLALFVTQGQVDMDLWIDRATKAVKGDAGRGQGLFNTICANCHGKDGRMVKEMPPVGKVASDNPWETLHKILNGEPGAKMPALRALDTQVSVDILSYAVTLPKDK
ncbi:MAG: c-type cytochrome [Magnetococcales bacterium]|nr:c-type cytochrome [Magnetococcales bacterium]